MKKLFLLFIVGIFVSSLVNAVPPVSTLQQFSEGYVLDASFLEHMKTKTDYELHVHVHNISNGKRIWGSVLDCEMHFFEINGSELFYIDATVDTDHYDFKIGGGNFTEVGTYSYTIHCNSTDYGGYYSTTVDITSAGFELTEAKAIIYIGLLGILVFLFLVSLIGASWLPSSDNKDDDGILLSINKLKYLRMVLFFCAWILLISIIYVGSNIALGFMETELMGDLLFTIFSIMFRLTIPAIILISLWILVKMFQDAEMKRMLERGVEMGKAP